MTADEHPKPQVTMEALAKLPAVFKKGKQELNVLDVLMWIANVYQVILGTALWLGYLVRLPAKKPVLKWVLTLGHLCSFDVKTKKYVQGLQSRL